MKSAMRTLDLIEYVVARPTGVVAQELASALSIPVSSLSYLLATLVERGYLRRDGRRYFASVGLDRLQRPRDEISLAALGQPFVKSLRDRVNETTSLFVRHGWEVEALLTEASDQALRYAIEVGVKAPMHCVSAGKALLAHLPAAELERYFDETALKRYTDFTLCDPSALREELDRIRQSGLAITRDEYTVGITGIGVAILVDGTAVAALSVGSPTPRLTSETEAHIAHQVARAGHALSAAWADVQHRAA